MKTLIKSWQYTFFNQFSLCPFKTLIIETYCLHSRAYNLLNWEFFRYSGIVLVRVLMICIAMLYLKAILQSIISIIVFVCVCANNQSELLYRSQTTLQQNRTATLWRLSIKVTGSHAQSQQKPNFWLLLQKPFATTDMHCLCKKARICPRGQGGTTS
jgi:hypothetical protein